MSLQRAINELPSGINPILGKRAQYKIILDGKDVTPRPLIYHAKDFVKQQSIDISEESRSSFEKPVLPEITCMDKISVPSDEDSTHIPVTQDMIDEFVLEPEELTQSEKDEIPARIALAKIQRKTRGTVEAEPSKPTLTITLRETPTIFLLEQMSVTAEKGTVEGDLIEKDNAYHEYMTVGDGRRRYVREAEAQTDYTFMKHKGSWAPMVQSVDKCIVASTWDLHRSLKTLRKNKVTKEI